MATKALLNGKLMFPSDYVSAVEFQGRDVTLTIDGVKIEDMAMKGGKKERKPIITFKETNKKLALNKTNAGTIADLYGAKAEGWAGKRITLYPTTTQFGRETVDCIRVRETVNGNGKTHQEPPPDLDPPEDQQRADLPDSPFAPQPRMSGEQANRLLEEQAARARAAQQSSSAPQEAPGGDAANDQSSSAGGEGEQHADTINVNGVPWPVALPDTARTSTTFINDAIQAMKPAKLTTPAARKKFHEKDVASWDLLPSERQDQKYAALMDESIWD